MTCTLSSKPGNSGTSFFVHEISASEVGVIGHSKVTGRWINISNTAVTFASLKSTNKFNVGKQNSFQRSWELIFYSLFSSALHFVRKWKFTVLAHSYHPGICCVGIFCLFLFLFPVKPTVRVLNEEQRI